MENTNPTSVNQEKEFDEKTMKYIAALFAEGKDTGFIISNLVNNGYGYDKTQAVVYAIHDKLTETQETVNKKSAPLDLILGIAILVIGILVTTSGLGIIAYGAIIVGIVKIIRGISNLN